MKSTLRIILCIFFALLCGNASADTKWIELGTGYFRDTFIDDSIRPVTIYRDADHVDRYRILQPYKGSDDDMIINTNINDLANEYPGHDKCETIFWYWVKDMQNIQAYFEPINFGSYRGGKIVHLYDFIKEDDFDNYMEAGLLKEAMNIQQGVISYLSNGEPGIIQLASCCPNHDYDLCGGERQSTGIITVFMPGQVITFKTDDKVEDSDKVYLHWLLGSKVDHARAFFCSEDEAEFTLEDLEGALTVSSSQVSEEYCLFSGDYIIKLIGYDENDCELCSSIDTFRYIAPIDVNDVWTPIATGTWYLNPRFTQQVYEGGEETPGLTLYQSVQNPYTFKIGNVWGDNDFYFTMTESTDLNHSSLLKWKNQQSNIEYEGKMLSFCSFRGTAYPYDGCVSEGLIEATNYNSNTKEFCLPLLYNIEKSKSYYIDHIYKTAFFTITGGPHVAGISTINGSKTTSAVRYYNINGQETNALHPGLNIVKSADGSSKVVMK